MKIEASYFPFVFRDLPVYVNTTPVGPTVNTVVLCLTRNHGNEVVAMGRGIQSSVGMLLVKVCSAIVSVLLQKFNLHYWAQLFNASLT